MSTDSAVSGPWLAVLIVGAWLVFFPLLWLGIASLLSVVGGWRELAATYAVDPATFKGDRARTTTGALQRSFMLPVNYSSCLLVYVRDDGVGLHVWRIFSFMHPPLFIPWTAVRDCQAGGFLFWRYAEVTLHTSSIRILVGGWPGKVILDRWTASRAAPAASNAMLSYESRR